MRSFKSHVKLGMHGGWSGNDFLFFLMWSIKFGYLSFGWIHFQNQGVTERVLIMKGELDIRKHVK